MKCFVVVRAINYFVLCTYKYNSDWELWLLSVLSLHIVCIIHNIQSMQLYECFCFTQLELNPQCKSWAFLIHFLFRIYSQLNKSYHTDANSSQSFHAADELNLRTAYCPESRTIETIWLNFIEWTATINGGNLNIVFLCDCMWRLVGFLLTDSCIWIG